MRIGGRRRDQWRVVDLSQKIIEPFSEEEDEEDTPLSITRNEPAQNIQTLLGAIIQQKQALKRSFEEDSQQKKNG